MAVQVVQKRRNTKLVLDLTKSAKAPPKPEIKKPEPKALPQPLPLTISAAEDGPPIAANLPEHQRGYVPAVRTLTSEQLAILADVIREAEAIGGPSQTLGLRLVLAASRHESAGAWPIGQLSRAFWAAGRPTEGKAVYRVCLGCRTSRFGEMAETAIEVLNRKLNTTTTEEGV
jgi:hypothetical protein